MKLAVVTWEKDADKDKPGDMQVSELKWVFDDAEVVYFNPNTLISGTLLQDFDVVQFFTGVWCGELEQRQIALMNYLEKPLVVIVPIGEAQKWETWQPEWLQIYLNQVWHPNVDLIGVVEENKLSYWKRMNGGKQVEYIGWPYPVQYVKTLKGQPAGKRIEIRPANNIPRYLSASLLKEYPQKDWCIHVNSIITGETLLLKRIMEGNITKIDNFNQFVSAGHPEWEDYLRHISECYIGIAPGDQYSLGRYALDFAAIERPLICGATTLNKKIFPDLVCSYYDIDKQSALLAKLYSDEGFYTECVEKSQVGLAEYTHTACRQFYMDAIKKVSLL